MEKQNNISIFKFTDNQEVRVILIDNDPWFIAKDVADILELKEVSKNILKLDADEKLIRKVFVSGQHRDMWLINESGLYALVLKSYKPEAKIFRKWITNEVLPQIRKTGSYTAPSAENEVQKLFNQFVSQVIIELDNRYVKIEDYDEQIDNIYEFANQVKRGFRDFRKILDDKFVEKTVAFVYLMYNPQADEYKIGQTNEVYRRQKQFQSVEPDIQLILKIDLESTRQALNLESLLKSKFSDKCTHGEWFKLNQIDVDFIRSLASLWGKA